MKEIGKIYSFDTFAEAFEFAVQAENTPGQWLKYDAERVHYDSAEHAIYIDTDAYYLDPVEPDRWYLTEAGTRVEKFVGYKKETEAKWK